MLGPRLGRYDKGLDPLPLGAPVNAVLGLFVLWWGWLAFNSGSTYGVRYACSRKINNYINMGETPNDYTFCE